MSKPSKDPLTQALFAAAHEVDHQHADDHAKMLTLGALPSWLTTVLSLVKPLWPAISAWIAAQLAAATPPPAPAANPAPATTRPIGA